MEFIHAFLNVLLAIGPLGIAALLAIWGFLILRRKKKKQELKWTIEEMFEKK